MLSGTRSFELNSIDTDSLVTTTKADVIFDRGSTRKVNEGTYRVTLATPATTELKTPEETFSSGLTTRFGQSPQDNGSDPRRVFVPGVGFAPNMAGFTSRGGQWCSRALTQDCQAQALAHELAHLCGWRDGELGKGVPYESGSAPSTCLAKP